MTDHDRARRCYGFACALAGRRPAARSARPWLARIAGYTPDYASRWGDDDWPDKATHVLDTMDSVHPLDWPGPWSDV